MIWKNKPDIAETQQFLATTLVGHLGIEITEIGDEFLAAKMPVDHRTVQPMRILHGGASVALAESLGSIAGMFTLDDPLRQSVVGVEINANHLKSVREGNWVYGQCKPIRIGRKIQVWDIQIRNEAEELTCISRITLAVIDNR